MRLFTAIDLPSDVLVRLERLLTVLRPQASINWSPLDNLHITTKFIGDWPESKLQRLHDALSELGQRPQFALQLGRLGWFPHERSPRVLWLGVDGGGALMKLASETGAKLCEALQIGEEERPYSPHLTLARIKRPVPLNRLRHVVTQLQPALMGSFNVSQFSLFRSDPGSDASIYRRLRVYSFEQSASAS